MTGLVCPECGHELMRQRDGSLEMTRRERDCLDAIVTFIAAHRCSPTYDEIAAAMGLRGKGAVWKHVDGLRALGFIERKKMPQMRRAARPTPKAMELYRHAA